MMKVGMMRFEIDILDGGARRPMVAKQDRIYAHTRTLYIRRINTV